MIINCSLLSPHARIPERQHAGDAGADLRAVGDHIIRPGATVTVPTGIAVEVPYGYVGDVRPRSGMAAKLGVTVLNSPGTIDHGYTGEVKVLLHNTSHKPVIVTQGDRIAQLVILPIALPTFVEVRTLNDTARGEGSFGSTGTA